MNARYAFIASSIAIAVLSLALFITVVGGTASNMSGAVSGVEVVEVVRDGTDNRLLASQRPNISQNHALSLTELISIYLPLLSTVGYIDKSAERTALMAIYNSTNGDEWGNNTGWGTNSSHCEWYGVTCDENEHVAILDLTQNALTGTIPSEIGYLPMLTVLRLPGTISCTNIYYDTKAPPPPCDPEFYQLSGPIPPEIGNLRNLQELILDANQLSSLPPEIGNLVNLQSLDLSQNQLTSLPPEIGNLAGMQEIGLWGNQLDSIPAEIGNLVNLPELYLSYNRLTSLPPEIGNLASLQVLVLEENYLATLPPEIGNLVSLQYLHLINNQLTSLPSEIGNLENLGYLYLSDNQLTSLPPEIGNLASLQMLSLGSNHLIGPIPAFLSNLGNLWYLNLEGNPDLTCWETQEARDWALSIPIYDGPTCFLP
jgi:hypothetical protein